MFNWDTAILSKHSSEFKQDRSFFFPSSSVLIPWVSCFSHKVKLRSPNKLEPKKLLRAGSTLSSRFSKPFLIAVTVNFLIPRELFHSQRPAYILYFNLNIRYQMLRFFPSPGFRPVVESHPLMSGASVATNPGHVYIPVPLPLSQLSTAILLLP